MPHRPRSSAWTPRRLGTGARSLHLAQRAEQLYTSAAAAAFLVTGILYPAYGHWTMTHQDFWRIYDVCLNRSWLSSALLKYNGHSLFWPSQIWLADLRFFGGGQELLFWIGLAIQLSSIVLLLALIWKDRAARTAEKLSASLILLVVNFWMQRATVTESGGFNCCYSLTLIGVATTFLYLAVLAAKTNEVRSVLIVIVGGMLATFSFGTGLMVWPTAITLAYCLRVRPIYLLYLIAAAILAITIFAILPGLKGTPRLPTSLGPPVTTLATLVFYFSRLLGSPFYHAAGAWLAGKSEDHAALQLISFWCGLAGAIFATVILGLNVVRRNLRCGIELLGVGLFCFTFTALAFITLGRATHIQQVPSELNAPRYVFWSALFWAGLLLVAISRREQGRPTLAALTSVAVIAAPMLLARSQFEQGVRCRFLRLLSDSVALSFINGSPDETKLALIVPSLKEVDRVSKQLKERRLGVFADGWDEWIGRPAPAATLTAPFAGVCRLDKYLPSWRGGESARLIGWAISGRRAAQTYLAVVDGRGTIQGIGKSFANDGFIPRVLYGGRLGRGSLLAYVANYKADEKYWLRAFDGSHVSAARIAVVPKAPEQ